MAHLQSDLLEITKDKGIVDINKGVMYLCVTIDHYSGMILQIAPLKNKRAESVALAIQECIWAFLISQTPPISRTPPIQSTSSPPRCVGVGVPCLGVIHTPRPAVGRTT